MSERLLAGDPAWLKAAFSRLGVSEIAGARHEQKVLEMYAAAGKPQSSDEVAWCSAFIAWCLKKAGLPHSGSLMARSYTKYGIKQDKQKRIPRGAICVWPRGSDLRYGHVNFCLEDDGQTITAIGGNQENGKGGGVTISRYKKSRLVSAVMPAPKKPKPKPEPPPPPPDIEPPPELPTPTQPDDPGPDPAPSTPKLPWHKKAWQVIKSKWTWVAASIFGGGFTVGNVDVTAEMILALCVLLIVSGGLAYGAYYLSKKESPHVG
jgi:uncharacterized protein (TIGR02594 family)